MPASSPRNRTTHALRSPRGPSGPRRLGASQRALEAGVDGVRKPGGASPLDTRALEAAARKAVSPGDERGEAADSPGIRYFVDFLSGSNRPLKSNSARATLVKK